MEETVTLEMTCRPATEEEIKYAEKIMAVEKALAAGKTFEEAMAAME